MTLSVMHEDDGMHFLERLPLTCFECCGRGWTRDGLCERCAGTGVEL